MAGGAIDGGEIQRQETEFAGRHLQLPLHRRHHEVVIDAIGANARGDQAALRGVEPQLAVDLRAVGLQRHVARSEA